jgi:hypothetical protein
VQYKKKENMKNFYKKNNPHKKNGGFMLLALLLAVTIGLIIWYLMLNPPVDRQTAKIQAKSPDKYPWVEENRLVAEDKQVASSAAGQVEFKEPLGLMADASQSDEPRGSILIRIKSDGRVEGAWSGDFETSKPRMNYMVVKCSFKGNIDPAKENADDASKLYFITKGRFGMVETNYDSGIVRTVEGDVYVTGWIAKDYSVTGDIHLTSDRKNQLIYQWSGSLTKMPEGDLDTGFSPLGDIQKKLRNK